MKRLFIFFILLNSVANLFCEKSITLVEAKDLLLQNNPEYQVKVSALKAAEWSYRGAFMSLLPSASIQGGYNYLDPKPYAAAQENYSLSYGLRINQPIFVGGRLWLSTRIERDKMNIARADLDYSRSVLYRDLEEAYYNFFLMKEIYNISHNSLKIADHNLNIAEVRLLAGTISRADYLQLQSEFSSKEVELLQARNNKLLSFRRLQNFIKIGDFEIVPVEFSDYSRLVTHFQNLNALEEENTKQILIEKSQKYNPLLIMSRLGKGISKKGLRMSQGNFLPTVNISVSKNWNDDYSGEASFQSSTTYVLSVSMPMFPLLDNYSKHRESYHSYRQTVLEVETTEDKIKIATEIAFYNTITSAKSITSAQIAFEFAQETHIMMEERYRNGLISTIDLINAEVLLTTSKLNKVRAKYDFLKNKSSLMNLLGIDNEERLLKLMLNDIY